MHDPARLAMCLRRARLGALWAGVTLVLGGAALGCSSHDRPSRPKAGRGIGPVHETPPLGAPPASTDLVDPRENPGQLEQALPAAAAAPSGEGEKDKEARDFSAELVRAFGDPASCLSPRGDDTRASQMPIALSTQVMPGGMVADSSVSAPGLAPEEVKCLRRRLENVRFATPIENAPFRVSGSMTLARTGGSSASARVEEKKREDKASKPQDPWQEPQAPAPVEQNTDYIEPQPAAAVEKIAAPRFEDQWKEPTAPPPVAQNTEPGEP